jgi:hypothetical protein
MFIVVVERTTQMQGIQVDPGTSQFRRLWATSTEKMMSTNMTRPDLSGCRFMRTRPSYRRALRLPRWGHKWVGF